jgi:hypothetical protein
LESRSPLSLAIDPRVLAYLKSAGSRILVARDSGDGEIRYESPSRIIEKSGEVLLDSVKPGRYVVVSAGLTNDFPIVTHWNQSLNSGHGGQEYGATDALGLKDIDSRDRVVSTSEILDKDSTNPFYFASDQYALFSSDPTKPAAKVPGFERYVGEHYSIYRITNALAVSISDKIQNETGFPVIHRSGRPGCLTGEIPEGIPAFQVIHACPVMARSDQGSLATFVLPPFWSKKKLSAYPLLFYGYYDIHETFVMSGRVALSAIGSLYKQGVGSAIAVLWNGGGAYGAFSQHRSAYQNLSLLMKLAQTGFAADLASVVTIGCSRGASTALAVASNPYDSSYRVKYAIAYSPKVAYGQHDAHFSLPTYPGYMYSRPSIIGYKFGWRQDWREPLSNLTGSELAIFNGFGTSDPIAADALSPASDQHLNALKARGTQVIVAVGSHDPWVPFSQPLKYVEELSARNIPYQYRISYRFGHCGNAPVLQDSIDALKDVFRPAQGFKVGVFHYRRMSEASWSTPVEFQPKVQPVFVEVPRYVTWNGPFLFSVVGPPGAKYALEIGPADAAAKNSKRSAPVLRFQGTLPVTTNFPIAVDVRRSQWPAQSKLGVYRYHFYYSVDSGTTWQEASLTPVTSGGDDSRFSVIDAEPMVDGLTQFMSLASNWRGWGLSSE